MCVSFELGSVSNLKKNTVGIIGMKFDKDDFVKFVVVIGDESTFSFNEKLYQLAKMDFGKRGTKGKLLK